jgi:hypothetical protein
MSLFSPYYDLGEFIFCYPDIADVPYPPLLAQVESYPGVQTQDVIGPNPAVTGMVYEVNQELPILLSWSPNGFARSYEIQIATHADFSSPVLDVAGQTDAFTVWTNAAPNTTYFYRVNTSNDGGTSDWLSGAFQTLAPMIKVTVPNGGEAWQRGLKYFIQWQDNIAENVVIDLYKSGVFLKSLATNALTGAFQWQIGLNLVPGNDYSIKISSATNGSLFGTSDMPFNIDVPKINSIQQNQAGAWVLGWSGTSAGVYVEYNSTLAPGRWHSIGGQVSGSTWTNAPTAAPEGFYRLRLQ